MSKLTIFNLHPDIQLLTPATETVLEIVATGEKVVFEDVRLIVTDDDAVNRLKKQFFDEDVLTDTISFNLNNSEQPIEGEIYISIDRIRDNARNFKTSFEQELILVLLHSFLHLVGYDDQTIEEKEEMNRLEQAYIRQLKIVQLFQTIENK